MSVQNLTSYSGQGTYSTPEKKYPVLNALEKEGITTKIRKLIAKPNKTTEECLQLTEYQLKEMASCYQIVKDRAIKDEIAKNKQIEILESKKRKAEEECERHQLDANSKRRKVELQAKKIDQLLAALNSKEEELGNLINVNVQLSASLFSTQKELLEEKNAKNSLESDLEDLKVNYTHAIEVLNQENKEKELTIAQFSNGYEKLKKEISEAIEERENKLTKTKIKKEMYRSSFKELSNKNKFLSEMLLALQDEFTLLKNSHDSNKNDLRRIEGDNQQLIEQNQKQTLFIQTVQQAFADLNS
ncbi:MAG: hypothetical protein LW832_07195 [Parachlamydia sp.]|nr:hypothetical protein [Parachlamydia sp.]